jgi:hypothetical protein
MPASGAAARRGAHARLRRQHGFDLAQLHAKAADLDLVVGAAQAVHLRLASALNPARQIPGAVQARSQSLRAQGLGRNFSAVSSGRPR